MKQLFIDAITPDTGKLVDFFQVRKADKKVKKDSNAYLTLELGDRTGSATGKVWDIPEGFDARPGSVVKIEADAGSYRDQLQLTVRRIRIAEADEVVKDDYIPASKIDRPEMLAQVEGRIQHDISLAHEGLGETLLKIVNATRTLLLDAPAAKKLHQAYLGGLLEHIINLWDLGLAVCGVYPDLDRDIILASALIHDIGKIHEYCYDTHIGETRQGRLTGHILQGYAIFRDHSWDLDAVAREHLYHIIASHHGNLEWGAARLPMTREAHVFHLIDMIDSRVAIITDAINGPVDEEGFTPFLGPLGTSVWNGK